MQDALIGSVSFIIGAIVGLLIKCQIETRLARLEGYMQGFDAANDALEIRERMEGK